MQEGASYQIIPIITRVETDLKTINFYLVKTNQSLILVDAGMNNEVFWKALQETLHQHGFSLIDITGIILTHNHTDHTGLVNRITSAHPVPVYAHPNAVLRLKRDPSFMEMRVEFFANLYEEMGCGEAGKLQVDRLKQAIEKNRNFVIQSDIKSAHAEESFPFQVIEVLGHSPDQIALFDDKTRRMISGDLLIDHISSNALVEPDEKGERLPALIQHKHSLETVKRMKADYIYPGHGILISNPNELIERRLTSIEKKAERMKRMIENGLSTGSEIAKTYYTKLYDTQFSLVMSEIIGHLDYLESSHQICKKKTDGVWHYSVIDL